MASLLSNSAFDPVTGHLEWDKPFDEPATQFLKQIPHADRKAFMHHFELEASTIQAREPEHRCVLYLANLAHSAFRNVTERTFNAISCNAGLALNAKVGERRVKGGGGCRPLRIGGARLASPILER